MIVTFTATIDSISEDGVVVFVGKPGGYKVPNEPEDVGQAIVKAFRSGVAVEVHYDDRDGHISDAKLSEEASL